MVFGCGGGDGGGGVMHIAVVDAFVAVNTVVSPSVTVVAGCDGGAGDSGGGVAGYLTVVEVLTNNFIPVVEFAFIPLKIVACDVFIIFACCCGVDYSSGGVSCDRRGAGGGGGSVGAGFRGVLLEEV